MSDNEITVTFHGATRKTNSHSGNPVWLLHTSEGDFRTNPDSQIGYDVENRTNTRTGKGFVDCRVVLTLTERERRVTHWRLADDDGPNTGEEKTIENYRTV